MIRAIGFAILLAGLGGPALANDCPSLKAFATQGATFELNGVMPTCTTSRQLGGGVSLDCHWPFAYRAEAARAAFAALAAAAIQCADSAVVRDTGSVNHPDSFEQITTTITGRAVSLSLKDKGARQETLIFLRVMTE